MLVVLYSQLLKQHPNRLCSAIQRTMADVHHGKHEEKKLDPVVPKLNIPPEFAGLYDVKQEPGYVIINGRRYPYPYPGIHGEYNYLKILDDWRKEGKVDIHNQPIFHKMNKRERVFAKQLFFQRDPTLPVWKLGKYDKIWNVTLATYFAVMALFFGYWFYRVIAPKESDIYEWSNWERWRKESHH